MASEEHERDSVTRLFEGEGYPAGALPVLALQLMNSYACSVGRPL